MPASNELNLIFPDETQVVVSLDGAPVSAHGFADPFTPEQRKDLRWYLEVYGPDSLGDPDDQEAARVAAQLPNWGKALFSAVFSDPVSKRLFDRFQDREKNTRPAQGKGKEAANLTVRRRWTGRQGRTTGSSNAAPCRLGRADRGAVGS